MSDLNEFKSTLRPVICNGFKRPFKSQQVGLAELDGSDGSTWTTQTFATIGLRRYGKLDQCSHQVTVNGNNQQFNGMVSEVMTPGTDFTGPYGIQPKT